MPNGARVTVGMAALLTLAVNFTACGSSTKDSMVSGSGAAGSGAGNTSAGSGGTSAINTGNSGGSANGSGTVIGVGGDGESCAAQVSNGKLVPLDMYIMLDISGSMLELTANNVTKWDAVKNALETFLKDQNSAGLGVGLQYFPQLKPNAPSSCTNDASCGDSGPCFTQFCLGYINYGVVACSTDADCPTVRVNGRLVNGAPCSALTDCSGNKDYVCPKVGNGCLDEAGNDIGQCELATHFTCEHTTNCDATAYSTPADPIAALPGAATALIASIDGTTPNGDTPTGPALTGAIQQATAWAKAHPDHRVVAVMATDGLPTECTPTDINQVGAIAAQGVASNPSINTFVIGVFGPADVSDGAPQNLDTIAQDGGTDSAFIVDTTQDVTAQFLAALDAIRGGKLECAFQIPEPSSGQQLDYTRVNVQVSSPGQADTVLYYVGSAAKCDAKSGGWYYDVDPAAGTPSQIITCASSCTAFQAEKDASVQIALGCQTIVK